jgi:hypothetical protein
VSTAPEPYTLADVERIQAAKPEKDYSQLRATVEALDAAHARVKELEALHDDALRQVIFHNRSTGEALARVEKAEAELGKWPQILRDGQKFIADANEEFAKRKTAEAELGNLRAISEGYERDYLAVLDELECSDPLTEIRSRAAALAEARASEARMREALVRMVEQGEGCASCGMEGRTGCGCRQELARAALSAPVSDWLAQRDRRVAEAQRRACAFMEDSPVQERVLSVPLVAFKPEGET